ncbi:hypothetical protein ACFQH6_07160 [Halobacteriaceae archaeon GCM10025711]
MARYWVEQDWTAFVTLHSSADGTARSQAKGDVENVLAGIVATERITDWDIVDVKVSEHPMAPFEPFTIAVSGTVTVVVDAADADAAGDDGATVIEDALSVLEDVNFTSTPAVTPVGA